MVPLGLHLFQESGSLADSCGLRWMRRCGFLEWVRERGLTVSSIDDVRRVTLVSSAGIGCWDRAPEWPDWRLIAGPSCYDLSGVLLFGAGGSAPADRFPDDDRVGAAFQCAVSGIAVSLATVAVGVCPIGAAPSGAFYRISACVQHRFRRSSSAPCRHSRRTF